MTRERVAAIALEWERTPYVHEGHVKGKAADCTFFMDVFEEAGLIEHVVLPHYGPQAHINRQAAMYINVLSRYTREIARDEVDIADIVMFRIARTWSHGAMVIPPGFPHIIHADLRVHQVMRAECAHGPLGRFEQRYFSFFGRDR